MSWLRCPCSHPRQETDPSSLPHCAAFSCDNGAHSTGSGRNPPSAHHRECSGAAASPAKPSSAVSPALSAPVAGWFGLFLSSSQWEWQGAAAVARFHGALMEIQAQGPLPPPTSGTGKGVEGHRNRGRDLEKELWGWDPSVWMRDNGCRKNRACPDLSPCQSGPTIIVTPS